MSPLNFKIRGWRSVVAVLQLLPLLIPGFRLTAQNEAELQPFVSGSASDLHRVATPSTSGTGEEAAQPLPPRVFGEPIVNIPYSSIFPTPLTFGLIPFPELHPGTSSGGFQTGTVLGLGQRGLQIPIVERGFSPQNAHLKLGPIYIKFPEVQAGVLMSDNINLTQYNREFGAIAFTSLSATVICQLSEGFQIGLAGTVMFLPFNGKFGYSLPGLDAALGFGISPIFETHANYDTMIAGWNVRFYDNLDFSTVRFIDGTTNDFLLFDSQGYGAYDRAGRYIYGINPSTGRGNATSPSFRFDVNTNEQALSNQVGFETTRLVPGDIRLSVNAFHENLWYNQGDRGLPNTRDQVELGASSERENLRFKPYSVYRATSINYGPVDQSLRVGVKGPITDLLFFLGEVGVYLPGQGDPTLLFRLGLWHTAGPNTQESLEFGRQVSDYDQYISTSLIYRLTQVLGPSLTGEVYALGGREEELNPSSWYNEIRAGVRLRYYVSPKTEIGIGGTYAYLFNSISERINVWTARVEFDYRITDTLTAKLFYQFQMRDSNLPLDSYYENLVVLSLSKYFQ